MRSILILTVALFAVACKKKPEAPTVPEKYENGILVLNEGLFEQNNASISFFTESETFQLVFKSENGRGLGDTANDFETYSLFGQDFIIIAMNVSSQIEIVDRYSMKSISQIPLFEGINARQPRDIEIKGTKAFVCNFDGTVAVIDLISHQIVQLIEVGENPDGMAVVEDRLYVSNSGGLNFPVYDSTMSVIDLNTLTVIDNFKTRINSTKMLVDSDNEIYLVSNGNYDDIPPALLRIDPVTNSVIETLEMPISGLTSAENGFYFYNSDEQGVYFFNTSTEEIDPTAIINVADYETFFGMFYDHSNARLFCIDANGYVNSSTVKAYDLSGNLLFEFKAGLLATDLIINN